MPVEVQIGQQVHRITRRNILRAHERHVIITVCAEQAEALRRKRLIEGHAPIAAPAAVVLKLLVCRPHRRELVFHTGFRQDFTRGLPVLVIDRDILVLGADRRHICRGQLRDDPSGNLGGAGFVTEMLVADGAGVALNVTICSGGCSNSIFVFQSVTRSFH